MFLIHIVLDSRQCRYAPLQPDRYLLYADRMVSGTSQTATSCQTACDSERHFRCRSFSVYVVLGLMQCSMSSSASPAYEVRNCLGFFSKMLPCCINSFFKIHFLKFIFRFKEDLSLLKRNVPRLLTMKFLYN